MIIKSKLKLGLWIAGVAATISPLVWAGTHPIQRPGDDWMVPWLFWGGLFCLLSLTVELVTQRRRRQHAD